MRELSLNILDITENSLKAKATLVEIDVTVVDNLLTIVIKDNGCGMSKEFLAKVTDPYTTTRTTRSVGLGIPLIKMEAEMSGEVLKYKVPLEWEPLLQQPLQWIISTGHLLGTWAKR